MKALDSAFLQLTLLSGEYLEKHKVSPDYKKILGTNLLLERVAKEFDISAGDSSRTIEILRNNQSLIGDMAYNSQSYFSLIGSIQEAFATLHPKDPWEVLEQMKRYLHGETYHYASLIYANILSQKLAPDRNPFTREVIINTFQNSKDTDLISFAKLIQSRLLTTGNVSAEMRKVKVIDREGHTFTLGDVLDHKKSKLKYLDIWASWCGPCIEGLPFSKDLSKRFGNGEISTFFISIDEDTSKWRNAYDKLGMNAYESYCLLDKINLDDFDNLVQIRAIPRYMLLDSMSNVLLISAPEAKKIDKNFIASFLQMGAKSTSPTLPPPPPPGNKNRN